MRSASHEPKRRSGPAIATAAIVRRIENRGVGGLLACAAHRHCVSPDELLGRARTLRCSRARHCFWAALRAMDAKLWSYSEIGRVVDRDHTTIMYGVQMVADDEAGALLLLWEHAESWAA